MIAKTKLEEILDELSPEFETARLRSLGVTSFIYLAHKERTVEIAECEGKFWLELWEKGNDEDDPATLTVDTCEQAIQKTRTWLG